MQVNVFYEKLNKVDGNIYVVEEEIHLTKGVYERSCSMTTSTRLPSLCSPARS